MATLRTVTTAGGRFGEWVAVASGLNAGDLLVAGDVSRLSEGARVKVVGEEDAAGASAPAGGEGGGHGAH